MKLIAGLGNPGKKYEKTRHNAGFRVLDLLAQHLGAEFGRKKFNALYAEGALPQRHAGAAAGDGRLLLVKPQTYMNLSGEPVAGFAGFYKVPAAEVLVVVDDVALPLGAMRLRKGGSAGGHNGLKDIEARLGTQEYARLRLGVGGRDEMAARAVEDLSGHVLGRFGAEEEGVLEETLKRAAEAVLIWAGHGVEAAMNRFNVKTRASRTQKDGTDRGPAAPGPAKEEQA